MSCRQKLGQYSNLIPIQSSTDIRFFHLRTQNLTLVCCSTDILTKMTTWVHSILHTYGETPIANVFQKHKTLKYISRPGNETLSNWHIQIPYLEDLLIFVSCLELLH